MFVAMIRCRKRRHGQRGVQQPFQRLTPRLGRRRVRGGHAAAHPSPAALRARAPSSPPPIMMSHTGGEQAAPVCLEPLPPPRAFTSLSWPLQRQPHVSPLRLRFWPPVPPLQTGTCGSRQSRGGRRRRSKQRPEGSIRRCRQCIGLASSRKAEQSERAARSSRRRQTERLCLSHLRLLGSLEARRLEGRCRGLTVPALQGAGHRRRPCG